MLFLRFPARVWSGRYTQFKPGWTIKKGIHSGESQCSPSITVAQAQILVSMPCVGWFCCWFLRYLLPTESFPWVLSGKLALTKSYPIWNTPTHFSFQFLKTPQCFAGKQQVTNYNIYYLGRKGEKSGCKSPFLRFWRSPQPF